MALLVRNFGSPTLLVVQASTWTNADRTVSALAYRLLDCVRTLIGSSHHAMATSGRQTECGMTPTQMPSDGAQDTEETHLPSGVLLFLVTLLNGC